MKQLFAIILLLIGQGQVLLANMASPVRPGTYGSSAFSSRAIDILSESITVQPSADFKTAVWEIEYHIRCDSGGIQIPLLFHALDYAGDFRIMLDGLEIPDKSVPPEFISAYPTISDRFPALDKVANRDGLELVFWDHDSYTLSSFEDMKFFEVELSRGEHRIRVDYTANAWTDRSGWVNAYSFRYSLSPARYWRSFGTLSVQLDTALFAGVLQTNLGVPVSRAGSCINWHFTKLPGDFFGITYTPELKPVAKLLVAVGPLWLSLCLASSIILLHVHFIRKFRKKHPAKRISWILILGSITVPLLALFSLPFAYDLIDNAIGRDAGRYHGYNFLVIFLYPVLLPVYGLLMWWIDRIARRSRQQLY